MPLSGTKSPENRPVPLPPGPDTHAHVINRPGVLPLLARQHWAASVAQLDDLEVSRSAVARACEAGVLARVHRGVVRLGEIQLSFAGRALYATRDRAATARELLALYRRRAADPAAGGDSPPTSCR